MPRGPRIDAPGILHHIITRGVGRKRIFLSDTDRENFLTRLEKTSEKHEARVYAWCLMDNHFHLALRTNTIPLAKTMASLLTAYAMYFNRQNKHSGHVFQNRYKSIVVDEERYFLSLLRYIHLNPVRAAIIDSITELETYPWTGHSALMGRTHRGFQDVDAVLNRMGKRAGAARNELVSFMQMDEAENEKHIFAGGGLRRSMGKELSSTVSGNTRKTYYDERILGSSDFVETVLKQNDEKTRPFLLKPEAKWEVFHKVTQRLCREFKVSENELLSGSKRRPVSDVRQLLSYTGCRQLGLPATEMSQNMNVSAQAVLKAAAKAEETWNGLDWLLENV